jgi:hypothetical protein
VHRLQPQRRVHRPRARPLAHARGQDGPTVGRPDGRWIRRAAPRLREIEGGASSCPATRCGARSGPSAPP